jgi:hypothetical protein
VITKLTQRKFDAVVQEWVSYPRQKYMKAYSAEFPRLLFPDGVSSITNISAGTKVGILFAIVIAALTKDGRSVLMKDARLLPSQYTNMIEAFELLLCYWAWLKKEEYWDLNDNESLQCAKSSIFETIKQLKLLFPRSTGNQWKIPKLHEQLHVAYYIWLYGSHQNIHTGPQEHNHIANSKKPSQQTQKRKKTFDWQLGNRLNDQYSIDFTKNQIQNQTSTTQTSNLPSKMSNKTTIPQTSKASKFEVILKLDIETDKIDVQYQWMTTSKKNQKLSQAIIELIMIHFFQ